MRRELLPLFSLPIDRLSMAMTGLPDRPRGATLSFLWPYDDAPPILDKDISCAGRVSSIGRFLSPFTASIYVAKNDSTYLGCLYGAVLDGLSDAVGPERAHEIVRRAAMLLEAAAARLRSSAFWSEPRTLNVGRALSGLVSWSTYIEALNEAARYLCGTCTIRLRRLVVYTEHPEISVPRKIEALFTWQWRAKSEFRITVTLKPLDGSRELMVKEVEVAGHVPATAKETFRLTSIAGTLSVATVETIAVIEKLL